MNGYRTPRTSAAGMAGTGARMLRGLLSVRALVADAYEAAERVLVRGRSSADPNAAADGQFDESAAETCQPVGVVARAASNAEVAAVVANVGGDGTNPYVLGTVDGTRALIIDARGIQADVTIVYNSTDVIELREGKIRLGSVGGTTAPLPTMDDFQALRSWVLAQFEETTGHVHATPAGLTTTVTAVGLAPAVVGTQRVEVE